MQIKIYFDYGSRTLFRNDVQEYFAAETIIILYPEI